MRILRPLDLNCTQNTMPLSHKISTRRDFMTRMSAGLGALSLSPFLPRTLAAASTAKSGKLGIALVGLGNYAGKQLAPALEQASDCYLAGIVTGTPEKEGIWAEKYGIKKGNIYNYRNFDRIASNPDIDIVYVVLPNSMHAEYTIRAANAGKHVICEKPMALNAAEAQTMIDACKRNSVQLSIGYRLHFDPNTLELMRLASEKPYGAVKYVQSEAAFSMGNNLKAWRLNRALAGGGAMMDMGVYSIQAARYCTGEEPIAVRAQEHKTDRVKFKEVDETITWQMEFPSGAYSNSTTSYNLRTNRIYVSYERGAASLEPATSYTGIKGAIFKGRTVEKTLDVQAINQQQRQMDGFSRGVRSGTPSIVPGEEGLADMKVIDAIYRSIANGGRRELI